MFLSLMLGSINCTDVPTLGVLVDYYFLICLISLNFLLDTVIVQIQQWGVVGDQQVKNQVLLNGVSLSGTSQEVDSIIQTMSADAHLSTLSSVKQTSALSKILSHEQMQ